MVLCFLMISMRSKYLLDDQIARIFGVSLNEFCVTVCFINVKWSKCLRKILRTFIGKTLSHMLNYLHFANLFSKITLEPKDLLVSFKFYSLFTKVLILYSIAMIQNLLAQDDRKFADLLPLIGKFLTYFLLQGKFHQQTSATPSGSGFSSFSNSWKYFHGSKGMKFLSESPSRKEKICKSNWIIFGKSSN